MRWIGVEMGAVVRGIRICDRKSDGGGDGVVMEYFAWWNSCEAFYLVWGGIVHETISSK